MKDKYRLTLSTRMISDRTIAASVFLGTDEAPSVFGLISYRDEGRKNGSMPYLDIDVASPERFMTSVGARLLAAIKVDIFEQLDRLYSVDGRSLRVRMNPDEGYVVIKNIGTNDAPDYVQVPVKIKPHEGSVSDLSR